ncbi:MAG: hypothetical protein K8R60_25085 [Burkholderiales bacterium]|nr:hypothetical protein [Burkholderiales bacterium]
MNPQADGAPPWIGLLLSGLAGRRVHVQALGAEAARDRPILTGGHLLLPVSMFDATAAPTARAAVAHAVGHLLHSAPQRASTGLKPMTLAVVSALEDARVERLLMQVLPGLRRWWAPFHAAPPADGDLSFAAFTARLGRVLFDPRLHDGNHWVDKGRKLFEAQAQTDLLDHDGFRRIGSILANDLGQMRIRFEPEQYRVRPAYRDDNSYLWMHPERVDVPPPDIQALDAAPQAAALELRPAQATAEGDPPPDEIELGRFLLPEWDWRLERHRRDWCTVIETMPLAPPLDFQAVRERAQRRARASAARLSRSRRLRRQLEGDEIDLDAAIDVTVDRRLGLEPDARFFKRPGRDTPRTSLLVLLDLSESANARIGEIDRTVLALEQEAALQLAQSVDRAAGRVAIDAFNSDTRERVSYQRLLDFGASFDAAAAGRLAGARARHSTRMGAALRRATDRLAGEASSRRSILVVSDGAPADIDVFDPRYLVEDARAAVLEARRRGVLVDCVTLDPAGECDARRIFGWRHYRVVTHPAALFSHLKQVQARAAC